MFSTSYSSTPNGCSLANILNTDDLPSRWDGDRPSDTYQNIIRFILKELFKHENDHGYLNPNYIFVTSGEAKVAQPCNDERKPPKLRGEFISLITVMLGNENNPKRLELKHFIKMAGRVTFEKLFRHPLLQSPSERYFFPIRVMVHMNDKKRRSWRQDYIESVTQEVVINSKIQTSICKDALELVLEKQQNRGKQQQNRTKQQQNRTKKLNQRTGDKNAVLDILDFSKNVANHINERLEKLGEKRMTEDEIENELTRMFPTRLIDLYEFLVCKKQISLAFLS